MRLFNIANGYLLGSIDIRRPIIARLNPGVIVSILLWLQELTLSRVLAKIYNSKRV